MVKKKGKKPKKREETNRKLDKQSNHEKFDNKVFSIKGPSANTNASNSSAAKRGAARSG